MEVSHYKISNIDVNSGKVEFYDTLTKKGSFVLASELYQQDRVDLFSEADQRIIAFYAGRQDTMFGKQRLVNQFKPKTTRQSSLIILVALYAVIFFVSNLTGSTLINLGSIGSVLIVAPAAIFVYSLTFLVDSLLTEIYGFSIVRRVYTAVALMSLFALLCLYGLSKLPAHNGGNYISELLFIKGNILRTFIVSFISFLVAEYINTSIISRLKYYSRKKYGFEETKERKRIIARFLIATSIGTMIDSLIFCFGVFLFVVPIQMILIVVMTQYVIKLSYDIVVCTFSSKLAMYIKRLEKTDIIELPSNKITNIVGFKIDSDRCVNAFSDKT
ncbi:VUT family protein [Cysteiniphilum halobium]|uniref:VUT family protein n=1 Tax=Cysteiniphilum halobium TaxID=2219059 RepID=UPI003F868134